MEKKTSTRKKTVKNELKKNLPTLLQAIERVVELSRDSKMSEEFMLEAAPEIGLLANSYGITERQAVLFCICMERGPRRNPLQNPSLGLRFGNLTPSPILPNLRIPAL